MLPSRPRRDEALGTAAKDGRVKVSEVFQRFFDELSATPAASAAADGDTTPSVKGLGNRGTLALANTAPTNVTMLDDGLDFQEVVLLCTTGNTTLVNAAGFRLSGGANLTPAANSTLVMKRFEGGTWRQIVPVVTT